MFDPRIMNLREPYRRTSTPLFPRIYSGAGWEGVPDLAVPVCKACGRAATLLVEMYCDPCWNQMIKSMEAGPEEIKVGDLVECLTDAEWIKDGGGDSTCCAQVGKQAVVREFMVRRGRKVVAFQYGSKMPWLWPVSACKKVGP